MSKNIAEFVSILSEMSVAFSGGFQSSVGGDVLQEWVDRLGRQEDVGGDRLELPNHRLGEMNPPALLDRGELVRDMRFDVNGDVVIFSTSNPLAEKNQYGEETEPFIYRSKWTGGLMRFHYKRVMERPFFGFGENDRGIVERVFSEYMVRAQARLNGYLSPIAVGPKETMYPEETSEGVITQRYRGR